jgi:hypothetical protein
MPLQDQSIQITVCYTRELGKAEQGEVSVVVIANAMLKEPCRVLQGFTAVVLRLDF